METFKCRQRPFPLRLIPISTVPHSRCHNLHSSIRPHWLISYKSSNILFILPAVKGLCILHIIVCNCLGLLFCHTVGEKSFLTTNNWMTGCQVSALKPLLAFWEMCSNSDFFSKKKWWKLLSLTRQQSSQRIKINALLVGRITHRPFLKMMGINVS